MKLLFTFTVFCFHKVMSKNLMMKLPKLLDNIHLIILFIISKCINNILIKSSKKYKEYIIKSA